MGIVKSILDFLKSLLPVHQLLNTKPLKTDPITDCERNEHDFVSIESKNSKSFSCLRWMPNLDGTGGRNLYRNSGWYRFDIDHTYCCRTPIVISYTITNKRSSCTKCGKVNRNDKHADSSYRYTAKCTICNKVYPVHVLHIQGQASD
jgi:hypothetical protein